MKSLSLKARMLIVAVLLLSGCASLPTPSPQLVPQCPKVPEPPKQVMQPQSLPDFQMMIEEALSRSA